MEFKSLIFDVKDRVAVIKMNRPIECNAMNYELMGELASALEICMVNNDFHVVVITGTGKAFCSGGDLAMFHGYEDKSEAIRELTKLFHHVILGIRQNPKPVIAAAQRRRRRWRLQPCNGLRSQDLRRVREIRPGIYFVRPCAGRRMDADSASACRVRQGC